MNISSFTYKFLIIGIISFLILIYFINENRSNYIDQDATYYINRDENVAIFAKDYIASKKYIVDEFGISSQDSLFNPTVAEITLSINILDSCFDITSNDIDTSEYVKQVFGFSDDNGKVIYIVGTDQKIVETTAWNDELIFLFDGGKAHFKTKVNLKNESCIDFVFNGEA